MTNLTPTANVVPSEHLAGWAVKTTWSDDVDRQNTHSFHVGADRALAERTAAAINDGVFWSNPEVRVDTQGQTYVHADALTIGRHLRTDLAKIGY